MRLTDVTDGSISVELMPDDCLLLARACHIAGENVGLEHSWLDRPAPPLPRPETYEALVAFFEAAACASAAGTMGRDEFTLPQVREAFDPALAEVRRQRHRAEKGT